MARARLVHVRSVKANAAWNMARTVAGMAFPLVTFPYTSRVLGPDGVGRVNFASSFTAYFVLLAAFGIPLYGIREIARVRNDPRGLTTVARELITIHLLTTIAVLAIFLATVLFVSRLNRDLPLFLVNVGLVVSPVFGAEWLYQGLEDYAYITTRTIGVALASVASIFIFVHRHEDYLIAAGIASCAALVNSTFNITRARRILFSGVASKLQLGRHLRPLATVFALNFVVSVYVNLDIVMLGFLSDMVSTGYYSAALRLTKMILGVVTSTSSVLLPRLSHLAQSQERGKFDALVEKSLLLVLFLCIPAWLGLSVLSHEIVQVLAGSKFAAAAPCVVVTAPIVLIVGLTGVTGTQILYPKGLERYVLVSAMAAAATSVSLNWILIPRFQQIGASVACLVAETIDFVLECFFLWKFCPIRIPIHSGIRFLLAGAGMVGVLLCTKLLIGSFPLRLVIMPPLGAAIYLGMVLLEREPFASGAVASLAKSIRTSRFHRPDGENGAGHAR